MAGSATIILSECLYHWRKDSLFIFPFQPSKPGSLGFVQTILDKMLKFRVPISQEVVVSNYPIYSNSFDIEEVWRLGKNIKELVNIPIEKNIFPSPSVSE